jgi:hypothetical protein
LIHDYGNNPEFSAVQHRKQAAFRRIQQFSVKIITVAPRGGDGSAESWNKPAQLKRRAAFDLIKIRRRIGDGYQSATGLPVAEAVEKRRPAFLVHPRARGKQVI